VVSDFCVQIEQGLTLNVLKASDPALYREPGGTYYVSLSVVGGMYVGIYNPKSHAVNYFLLIEF